MILSSAWTNRGTVSGVLNSHFALELRLSFCRIVAVHKSAADSLGRPTVAIRRSAVFGSLLYTTSAAPCYAVVSLVLDIASPRIRG
jgi:hypothetical protein